MSPDAKTIIGGVEIACTVKSQAESLARNRAEDYARSFVQNPNPKCNGAYIYNWRVALASAPTTYVKQVPTTAASNTFDDLTPGQLYNVELNAVGTAGTTDWSGPGELMII